MPCTNISNSHPGQKYVKFQFVEHFYKFEANTRSYQNRLRPNSKSTISENDAANMQIEINNSWNDAANMQTRQQFSVENLEISFLNISTSKMSNFQLAHIQKDPICQANLRKMKISQNDIENAGTRPRFSLGNPEIALSNTSASKMSNLKIAHAPPLKNKNSQFDPIQKSTFC